MICDVLLGIAMAMYLMIGKVDVCVLAKVIALDWGITKGRCHANDDLHILVSTLAIGWHAMEFVWTLYKGLFKGTRLHWSDINESISKVGRSWMKMMEKITTPPGRWYVICVWMELRLSDTMFYGVVVIGKRPCDCDDVKMPCKNEKEGNLRGTRSGFNQSGLKGCCWLVVRSSESCCNTGNAWEYLKIKGGISHQDWLKYFMIMRTGDESGFEVIFIKIGMLPKRTLSVYLQ